MKKSVSIFLTLALKGVQLHQNRDYEKSIECMNQTVIPFNKAAIRLYEKLGFEPTGEIFKGHHDEHVYHMKVKQVV
ncbi:GNAT family protein [Peribacillus alkalitolerans]|uniref:GNAT family protein n=1 Tax=Peribacillus alkalitolerans TaxID=1550385 RepID=UPI001F075831|nr:GNAT family protein [Peribacillus alkalitolerans]